MPGIGSVHEPGTSAVTPGKRRDHVTAGLGLPPGVDDGAALAADILVVPHPRLGIDRLADGAQQPEARQVVVRRRGLRRTATSLDQRADRGRRGVEDRDLVLRDRLPEAAGVRIRRNALEHDFRRTDGERAVRDIRVSGHPADVGRAPEDILRLDVEHPAHRQHRPQQVAAGAVLHPLRLAGRARRVEDEERVLGADPFRLAGVGLLGDELVQPQVARRRECDVAAGALVDDDVADAFAAAHRQRFVDDRLERQVAAAAGLLVGRDHGDRTRIDDPLLQRLGREPAEHDRMRRADPGAGLHRHHALDRHRHVDEHAVALLDAERLEPVREAANPLVELAVGDLRHRAVVRFEDDRNLVRVAVLQVAIEAVVGDVEQTVVEPLVKRGVRLVERPRERLVPDDLVARELRPEPGEVLRGARVHRVEIGLLDVRLRDEARGRFEQSALGGYRFDRGHGAGPPGGACGRRAAARPGFGFRPPKSNQLAAAGAMRGT